MKMGSKLFHFSSYIACTHSHSHTPIHPKLFIDFSWFCCEVETSCLKPAKINSLARKKGQPQFMSIFIIRITKFISDLYLSSEKMWWDFFSPSLRADGCWWDFHLILSKIDYVSASNWFELLAICFCQFLPSFCTNRCSYAWEAHLCLCDGILLRLRHLFFYRNHSINVYV